MMNELDCPGGTVGAGAHAGREERRDRNTAIPHLPLGLQRVRHYLFFGILGFFVPIFHALCKQIDKLCIQRHNLQVELQFSFHVSDPPYLKVEGFSLYLLSLRHLADIQELKH